MLPTILITIDVEDWFQVENFRPWIPFDTWDQRELRVERNVHRLLNLFDSIELTAHSSKLIADNQNETDYELSAMSYEKSHPRVTFFILGWLAERLPHLVREIHFRGHEVASHGNEHNLCDRQTTDELKKDLTESKKRLEDIIGSAVHGFRAPNFSINDDILKLIEDCGYGYDSSYNSFALHGRYGKIALNGHIKKGIAYRISDNFFELPISNLTISYQLRAMSAGQKTSNFFVLPFGGGGYFRLMPYRFFSFGVRLILKKDGAYVFYIHPWEIDPNQPRVKEASLNYRFRHYINLGKARVKLFSLMDAFHSCQFTTCSEYLESLGKN